MDLKTQTPLFVSKEFIGWKVVRSTICVAATTSVSVYRVPRPNGLSRKVKKIYHRKAAALKVVKLAENWYGQGNVWLEEVFE